MLDQIIKKNIAKNLRTCGFVRKQYTWNRLSNGFVQVINFQKSDHSSVSKDVFTINYGIFSERVWSLCWDKPSPKVVLEVNCFPRFRAGDSLSDFQGSEAGEVWWTSSSEHDDVRLADEVGSVLDTYVIPQLNGLNSFSQIIEFFDDYKEEKLIPIERIYLSIFRSISGDSALALASLEKISEISPAWEERVDIITSRLSN